MISAGQHKSEQAAQAFTKEKNLPVRNFSGNQLPQLDDVLIIKFEGINVAARPIGGFSKTAQFKGVRTKAPGLKIIGQELPAGRVGAEAMDQEQNRLGINSVPLAVDHDS